MFSSGQTTIYEGYAKVKLWKAGLRSNTIDPNARHCMASAAVAFMRTFGMDEPMGCYNDIEKNRCVCALGFKHGGNAPNFMVSYF